MPLLKRKTFSLVETPRELEPSEKVYQVRFTKEIFHDYQEYLNRINLYRQRLWTCKFTGKSNLTYEEALVSEKRANEKVQQFPQELVGPALHIIQFSMLPLKDLADTIALKLQDCLFAGIELYGKREDGVFPCRVVKVLNQGASMMQYEVLWLSKDKGTAGNSLVTEEELIKKKLPFSRSMLKSFVRESTYRNVPWVVHDRLAEKHGISKNLPEDLKSKFYFYNGLLVNIKKRGKNVEERKRMKEEHEGCHVYKRRKKVDGQDQENSSDEADLIKYPIEDLLVRPGADDPAFTTRPSPSRDFKVPMDCVGDLLTVWDFCSSFSRLLHLSPFSLEDFENAICHKDSNLVLIVETHAALLRLLMKDGGEYSSYIKGKKRKAKITLVTWTEYLCDFLDMASTTNHLATIKRGHYGLLDVHTKLGILQLLMNHALESDLVRELLDEYIEQWHELGATRREKALKEAKVRREEKERLKAQNVPCEAIDENIHNDGVKCAFDEDNVEQRVEIVSRKSVSSRASVASKNNVGLAEDKDGGMPTPRKGLHQGEPKVSLSSKEQRKQYYEREMEKRCIRTNPLGRDKHRNRYWWFRRDGRIFVESADHKLWGYYSTKEELDLLFYSLNCKGEREKALYGQLEKYYTRICGELQKRSKDLADKIAMEEAVLRRSTRVRAPPRDNPANAFLRYVNKWKEE